MADQWREFAKETVALSGTNFIEVKLSSPPDGDKLFVGISKGWQTEGGDRRYKSNVTVPAEKARDLVDALQRVVAKTQELDKGA